MIFLHDIALSHIL